MGGKKYKKMIIVEQEGIEEQEKQTYITQRGSRWILGDNTSFASIIHPWFLLYHLGALCRISGFKGDLWVLGDNQRL
jgi:hypothetical protein